ncbi:hypothetical protein TWF730_010486 [Orbilia blumenaviensis]|uniref:Fido domain-containing protein n=1 Tax=Orbilia blumenaviensis TaxID=1796055 RepID=A0AAV9US50_9PEZI
MASEFETVRTRILTGGGGAPTGRTVERAREGRTTEAEATTITTANSSRRSSLPTILPLNPSSSSSSSKPPTSKRHSTSTSTQPQPPQTFISLLTTHIKSLSTARISQGFLHLHPSPIHTLSKPHSPNDSNRNSNSKEETYLPNPAAAYTHITDLLRRIDVNLSTVPPQRLSSFLSTLLTRQIHHSTHLSHTGTDLPTTSKITSTLFTNTQYTELNLPNTPEYLSELSYLQKTTIKPPNKKAEEEERKKPETIPITHQTLLTSRLQTNNHTRALIHFITTLLSKSNNNELSQDLIKQTHRLLVADNPPIDEKHWEQYAGWYRDYRVLPYPYQYQYPHPHPHPPEHTRTYEPPITSETVGSAMRPPLSRMSSSSSIYTANYHYNHNHNNTSNNNGIGGGVGRRTSSIYTFNQPDFRRPSSIYSLPPDLTPPITTTTTTTTSPPLTSTSTPPSSRRQSTITISIPPSTTSTTFSSSTAPSTANTSPTSPTTATTARRGSSIYSYYPITPITELCEEDEEIFHHQKPGSTSSPETPEREYILSPPPPPQLYSSLNFEEEEEQEEEEEEEGIVTPHPRRESIDPRAVSIYMSKLINTYHAQLAMDRSQSKHSNSYPASPSENENEEENDEHEEEEEGEEEEGTVSDPFALTAWLITEFLHINPFITHNQEMARIILTGILIKELGILPVLGEPEALLLQTKNKYKYKNNQEKEEEEGKEENMNKTREEYHKIMERCKERHREEGQQGHGESYAEFAALVVRKAAGFVEEMAAMVGRS